MSLSAPHVVMLVANDVRTDTRVRKTALALAAAGARVTVVGLAPDGRREETTLGDVTVLRVPVRFALRDARLAARRRRRRARPPLLREYPVAAQTVARTRLAVRERDLVLGGGGAFARRLLALRAEGVRARTLLGRVGERVARDAWRAYDKAVGKVALGASWRRWHPEVEDWELAAGGLLDALAPDLLYAHDVHLVGVAARASARAGRRVPWVYDAHEWVTGLSQYGGRTRRVVAAWADLERDYVRRADRVVTVSPPLARALRRRYRLRQEPTVVLNIPPRGARTGATRSLRAELGLAPDVPLLVYSGGVQAARGVQDAVAALPSLPGAHLAVVAVPHTGTPAVTALRTQAAALGVTDRLHLVEPVAPHEVAAFLSSADVGLIPLRHFGSHEMALANKLFEYLHAGIPCVVSDCEAQREFVTQHRTGLVHRAGDPADLARAVSQVLADPGAFRVHDEDLVQEFSWQSQATVLQQLVRELLPGSDWREAGSLAVAEPPEERVVRVRAADAPVVLAVGPSNSAGQGWAWSRAAASRLADVTPYVVARHNGRYDFPADEVLQPADYRDPVRGQAATDRALGTWTHVLMESGRPILGTLHGKDFRGDLQVLTDGGVTVGLVFHGSDVRDPRTHAAQHRWSPFRDPRDPYTRTLQSQCDELHAHLEGCAAPLFVSTPDLLAYVPGATWLPLVVDVPGERTEPALTAERPLVVHAPSRPELKGTEWVEKAVRPLVERGLVDYRLVTGLPPAEAKALVARADVVVDQLLLGGYGVVACEGMAAGAVVLGYLGEQVRARVDEDVPVLEATPETLGQVLEQVLADRPAAQDLARRGREFVARRHDGTAAARALAPFLGRPA
jgi:glycosyltransferase involved in cell wall biosynthesis